MDTLLKTGSIGLGLRNSPKFYYSAKYKKLFGKYQGHDFMDIQGLTRDLKKDLFQTRVTDIIGTQLIGVPEKDMLITAGFGGGMKKYETMEDQDENHINVFDIKSNILLAKLQVAGDVRQLNVDLDNRRLAVISGYKEEQYFYVFEIQAPKR